MRRVTRTILGVVLITLGVAAALTPFSPGSWLALIGLEILGLKMLIPRKLRSLIPRKHRSNAKDLSKENEERRMISKKTDTDGFEKDSLQEKRRKNARLGL